MKDLSCIKISDAASESLEVGPLKEGDSLFRGSENIEDSFLTNSRKAKRENSNRKTRSTT